MISKFKGRDVISVNDFSRDEIDFILDYSSLFELKKEGVEELMKNKIMLPAFFENSSRTTLSFDVAMRRLGGQVSDFDPERSSRGKGESLWDTAITINNYSFDVVVVRERRDGVARLFADIIEAPVINAGDGINEHPTQTFLDLYTIKKKIGRIDGLEIAIVGDLKYGRTVHSLANALKKYKDCKVYFISPQETKLTESFVNQLKEDKLNFEELDIKNLEDILGKIDAIYMTRVQRERFPEGVEGEFQYKKVISQYCLTKDMLDRAKLRKNFIILHPRPRRQELPKSLDNTPYSAYIKEQEKAGLYVRMGLINLIAGDKFLC
ncbi:MAG: aspartate carbamoyltransferase [Candidatus Pacearchaeota archaeon]